jgi:hypothetical protein
MSEGECSFFVPGVYSKKMDRTRLELLSPEALRKEASRRNLAPADYKDRAALIEAIITNRPRSSSLANDPLGQPPTTAFRFSPPETAGAWMAQQSATHEGSLPTVSAPDPEAANMAQETLSWATNVLRPCQLKCSSSRNKCSTYYAPYSQVATAPQQFCRMVRA